MAAEFYGGATRREHPRKPTQRSGWCLLVLLVGLLQVGRPQNPATLQILALEIHHDTLFCRLSAAHLLDQPVEKTLLSGLPVHLEIRFNLSHSQQLIDGATQRFRMNYDIWEDRFTVQGTDELHDFTRLDSLRRWWRDRRLPVISIKKLPTAEGWHLQVHSRVVLLANSGDGGFKQWLNAGQPVEENEPSQDRDTGFKLNLNDLIGLFLKKDQVLESFQDQQTSNLFNLRDLPAR